MTTSRDVDVAGKPLTEGETSAPGLQLPLVDERAPIHVGDVVHAGASHREVELGECVLKHPADTVGPTYLLFQ